MQKYGQPKPMNLATISHFVFIDFNDSIFLLSGSNHQTLNQNFFSVFNFNKVLEFQKKSMYVEFPNLISIKCKYSNELKLRQGE